MSDPLTLGTIWRGLIAAANDGGIVLQQTAYSEAVREARDFSVAVFDRAGRMVAQGDYSPGHLGSMPGLVSNVLEHFPAAELRPGDAVLLNDPWLGSGHLPDFLLTTPIFWNGELAGYVATCMHMIDVGGAVPGSQAVVGIADRFQEGLRLPPVRAWREGRLDRDLEAILAANVRVPDKLLGDLRAAHHCNRLVGQRLEATLDRFGLDRFDRVCDEILERSERRMREAIAGLRDGSYAAVDHLDDCGPDTEPLRIEVAVIVDGDELTLDFAGSSPQTRSGMNAVANYTRAYAYFTVSAVLHGPSLPQNAGSLRPIRWTAPSGSVVNARPPAGTGGRAIMQQRIVDAIMQALVAAAPDRVIAPSSHWGNPVVGGVDPATGEPFVFYDVIVGGFGGRPAGDGVEAMSASFNINGIPTEVSEHAYPIVVEAMEFIPDSGGAGRWRGGMGVRKDVRLLGDELVLSNLGERHAFEPPGILGGLPGARGETVLDPGTSGERSLQSKAIYELECGSLLSFRLSGGGGYGDPLDREPERVARDVAAGWVSPDRASEAYGVVVDAAGSVDRGATEALRRARRSPG